MWIIRIETEDCSEDSFRDYSVGYFHPDGYFCKHRWFLSIEEAEEICNYLNGGGNSTYQPGPL